MAARLPLVIIGGQVQQLPSGDTVTGAVASDPVIGSQNPAAFSLATGQYALIGRRLILTSTSRVTLAGTAALLVQG